MIKLFYEYYVWIMIKRDRFQKKIIVEIFPFIQKLYDKNLVKLPRKLKLKLSNFYSESDLR